MSDKPIIAVSELSKAYRLGTIGGHTFRHSLSQALRRFRQSSSKEPESFWALQDVSFQVKQGEVLGVIGRNGAGKSTLLKILSRITEPTGGEAILRGRVASLLEVGTGFHPELTGRENTYLNGAILGMSHAEISEKLESISTFAGVQAFMDTPVKRYSSGMRVRLAFAVAAHLDPEILIIDEVLAVGDASFQQKCLGKINEVARSGRTVIFVSHNMAAVQSFCSRVLVIDSGKVVFDGETAEGVERYYRSFSTSDSSGSYTRTSPPKAGATAWIKAARLINLTPSDDAEVRCGAPLTLEVEIVSKTPLAGMQLGIGIENAHGIRACTLHTRCDPDLKVQGEAGVHTFQCTTDSIALAAGQYYVLFQLDTGRDVIELLENAISFRVLESDVFRNGGRAVPGMVLVPQRWAIRQEASDTAPRSTEPPLATVS